MGVSLAASSKSRQLLPKIVSTEEMPSLNQKNYGPTLKHSTLGEKLFVARQLSTK